MEEPFVPEPILRGRFHREATAAVTVRIAAIAVQAILRNILVKIRSIFLKKDNDMKLSVEKGIFVLLLLAGGLTVFAFPPIDLFVILFITYPFLFYEVDKAKNKKQAFLRAAIFGGSFFVFQLFWAVKMFYWNYSFPVYFLFLFILFLLGCFFYGIPAFLAFFYKKSKIRLLAFCCFLALSEWVRSYIVFQLPWNLSASMFTGHPVFLQINSLIGPFGCCLLFNFIFISPLFLLKKYHSYIFFISSVILLIGIYTYGAFRLKKASFTYEPEIFLRLVQYEQPKIPGENLYPSIITPRLFDELMEFVQKTPLTTTDMVIFPENIFKTEMEKEPFLFFEKISKEYPDVQFLGGVIRLASKKGEWIRPHNSMIVFNNKGKISHIQDKWKLVPLGEYVPFIGDKIQPLTDFGNNAKGDGPQTFHVKGLPPFAPVNCIELIYPRIFIDRKDRPQWIANSTNDSGFIHDAGAYQFLSVAQLRAVEEGLPVIRVTTPHGMSAVVNGYGIIEKLLPVGHIGMIDTPLPKALPPTLYSKLGNWPFLIISLALLSICLLLEASEKKIKE